MPITYEPIATTTLGTAAADITFSSIPATYTDLRIVWTLKSAGPGNDIASFRINNDSTSLYSATYLWGDGTSVSSARASSATLIYCTLNNSSTTVPHFATIDLFSYAGSTNKTSLITYSGDNNGSGDVNRHVGLYRSTSSITSVKIFINGVNMAIGTTATLYGILRA
jgi:hypothetical protein